MSCWTLKILNSSATSEHAIEGGANQLVSDSLSGKKLTCTVKVPRGGYQ